MKWPVLGIYLWPNFHVFDTYEEEVLYLKSWISQRLSWMDSQIFQLNVDKYNEIINYAVHNAYPNPYNSTVNIKYDLQSLSNVKIAIHDILGREIKILLNTRQLPGSKMIQWDSTDNSGDKVAAGVYLYSLEIDGLRDLRKIIYLK